MVEKDVNQLIDKSISALQNKDALALRNISADALTEAAVEGHRELILLALVDYALSKVLSKVRYESMDLKFYGDIIQHFKDAKAGPKEATIKHLEAIENSVVELDEEQGNYTDNLMEKARIKKATSLYEKGLSLRRAAEMTGADPAKVLEFVGGSKIHEFEGNGRNAQRLAAARGVFGK